MFTLLLLAASCATPKHESTPADSPAIIADTAAVDTGA